MVEEKNKGFGETARAAEQRSLQIMRYEAEIEDALANYTKAIELNPQDATAYIDRGILYHQELGDSEAALMDFNEAIRLNPEDATAYNNRGQLAC